MNYISYYEKEVRYHKGGFLCARQTCTGWEKSRGWGVCFVKVCDLTCILLSRGDGDGTMMCIGGCPPARDNTVNF